MGKFQPGTSGNPAGRPPGTPNRVTGDIRQALADALAGEIEMLPVHLEMLKPRDRLKALAALLPYVLPRAFELTGKDGGPILTSYEESMSDDERAARIAAILDAARHRRDVDEVPLNLMEAQALIGLAEGSTAADDENADADNHQAPNTIDPTNDRSES